MSKDSPLVHHTEEDFKVINKAYYSNLSTPELRQLAVDILSKDKVVASELLQEIIKRNKQIIEEKK